MKRLLNAAIRCRQWPNRLGVTVKYGRIQPVRRTLVAFDDEHRVLCLPLVVQT